MVVTRLSHWMTWSTCEWLRWWLLDSVTGWRGLPVSGWDGGYSTQSLDDVVYLWVAEMVVTRLSRWMTWSTCEWLRWWLLDSVTGWRGLPVSGWDGGYSTQSLDDVVYLWVAEMVVTRLSHWMTWSTCEWLRWWLLNSVAGWRGLPVSGWDGGYSTQSLGDMVYLWVVEMVVTRLSHWMTWSTCEWLRWWLLDSVAGRHGLPVSGWDGGY